MKNRVSKKQIIIISIFSFINLIYAIVCYFLRLKDIIRYDYYYLNALVGAIFLFLGWIIPNHFEFSYRKKNAYYKGKLPIELRNQIFSYRMPLFTIGFISLFLSVIFYYL